MFPLAAWSARRPHGLRYRRLPNKWRARWPVGLRYRRLPNCHSGAWLGEPCWRVAGDGFQCCPRTCYRHCYRRLLYEVRARAKIRSEDRFNHRWSLHRGAGMRALFWLHHTWRCGKRDKRGLHRPNTWRHHRRCGKRGLPPPNRIVAPFWTGPEEGCRCHMSFRPKKWFS